MPDIDQLKDQAEEAASTVDEAASNVEPETEGAAKGSKSMLDRDGDGDTDLDDVKALAKEATDKVKGLFQKK